MSRMPRRRTLIAAFAALMAASPLAAIVPSATVQAAEPEGPQVTVSPGDDLDPDGETVTVTGSGFDTSGGKGIYVRFCAQADGEVGTPEGRPGNADCNGNSEGKGAWIGHGPPSDPLWDGDGFELELEAPAAFGDVDCLDPDTVCGFATQSDHTAMSFFGNDTFTPVTFAADDEGPGEPDPGNPDPGGPGDPDPGNPDPGGPGTPDPGQQQGDRRARVTPTTGIDASGDHVTVKGSGYPGSIGVYVRLCEAPGGRVGTMAGRPANCDGQGVWVTTAQTGPGTAPISGGAFDVRLPVAGAFTGETAKVDCTEPGSCGIFIRRDHFGPTDTAYDAWFPIAFADDTEAPDVDEPLPPSLNDVVLEVSPTTDVDDGATLAVKGSKYAPGRGVYVQFCAAPEGQLGTAAGRPNRCYPGQDGTHTVWVSPVDDDGTFRTNVVAEKTFTTDAGEEIDCSEPESCGVVTRRDHDGGANDHSQDAFVPITFGDGTAAPRGVGRITADRTAGLAAAGDTITVTGEGFRPNTAYAMTVCAEDGFTCDYGNVTEMTTDADGGFREPLAVQGEFSGVECGTAGCEVNTWAVSMSTPEDEATLPIGFVGGPLPRTGSDPMPLTLTGLGLLALGGAAVGVGRRRRFGGLG